MNARPVPRAGRVLDLIGAFLFLVGAVLYAYSWLGLRAMDEFERDPGSGAFAAIERADELSRHGRIGFAVMAAGVVVAVVAAIVAKRLARRA